MLWAFRPTAVWDWLNTLAATFISVVFAVALFWYQRDKADEERQGSSLSRSSPRSVRVSTCSLSVQPNSGT